MKNELLTICSQTLKARKRYILTFLILGLALLWMYIGLFPAIAEKSDEFNQLLANYPESFSAFLGVNELNFSNLENFLAVESFSIMWPLLSVLMLLGFAGPAIAGEIEKGTIEFVLSRPVSRLVVFGGRYMAFVLAYLFFVIFSVLAVFPLAAVSGIEVSAANHFAVAFMGLLFGLTVLSLAMLCSVIFSEKSKVYFTAGAILGAMYTFSAVANLTENLSVLKYFSFFYYFDGVQVLIHNQIKPISVLLFLVFALAAGLYAAYHFNKRDIAV